MKLIKYSFVVTLLISFFWSCKKHVNFPLSPQITFNAIYSQIVYDTSTKAEVDSLTITLNFKDGDGDLGVNTLDQNNLKYKAYADSSYDSNTKKDIYTFVNFRSQMYRKEKGKFMLVPINTNGTFPELISYNEVGPIEGTFNYTIDLPVQSALASGLKYNDTVRFEVYLIDRTLNKSNVITTDSIIIFKKAL
jgi:hypothetical protein